MTNSTFSLAELVDKEHSHKNKKHSSHPPMALKEICKTCIHKKTGKHL